MHFKKCLDCKLNFHKYCGLKETFLSCNPQIKANNGFSKPTNSEIDPKEEVSLIYFIKEMRYQGNIPMITINPKYFKIPFFL